MTGPYTYQNSDTALKIAESALKKNHEVRIHLFVDGPINGSIHHYSNDKRIPLIYKQFENIRDMGAKITYCPTCGELRGTKDHMIENSEPEGLASLGEFILEADKVLTFGMA